MGIVIASNNNANEKEEEKNNRARERAPKNNKFQIKRLKSDAIGKKTLRKKKVKDNIRKKKIIVLKDVYYKSWG